MIRLYKITIFKFRFADHISLLVEDDGDRRQLAYIPVQVQKYAV